MPNFSALPPAALVRTLLALFVLALRFPAVAQAPVWQSARAVGVATGAANSNYSTVVATAVDASGNVFLAGNFTNTITLGGTTLTSLGGNDVFIAKFSPVNNQFLWAQSAGGTGNEYVAALAVSGTSLYIVGSFRSITANFGSVTLANAGDSDVFVAKLTDAGSTGGFVWAQRGGGTGNDGASAVALNGTNVYVAGYFGSATAVFGSATLANAGEADVFVAKMTDSGSFVWAQWAGGTGSDAASALVVSGTSVYVAGHFFSSVANFGAITLPGIRSDVFVAKLTDAGSSSSFVWAQRAGGAYDDVCNALAVRGNNVYIAGGFSSYSAVFGNDNLVNMGYDDIFVAKLIDLGATSSFVWAQRAGGAGYDEAKALTVNGSSVFLAGYFDSAASFGVITLPNRGLFVAKLTDAGSTSSFEWVQRTNGADRDEATALATNATGVWIAGVVRSATATFGSGSIANANNPNPLGFLATLTDPTLTATTAAAPRTPAQLFPNPARHAATLRLPAGTAPAPLTLADALGRPVRRYPAPAGPETALDLRGLPAGLYLLRGAGPAQRLAVE